MGKDRRSKPREVVQQRSPRAERRSGARKVVAVAAVAAAAVTLRVRERRRKRRAAADPDARARLTVKLPVHLIERLRNAVFYTQGMTLTGLVEQSLSAALAAIEEERGEPFPERTADLQPGRPSRAPL